MAETLGDALLNIRTNDGTFYSDVNRAKGASEQLGASMDKTSGSSKKLATEMSQTGRSAKTMGDGFQATGKKVTQSAGSQRAGMQQLSFQLNDVATMYSLGARPMQIFASQSGQVVQAVQLMTGGTSKLAGFLGGPWGIALTSAAIVLTPFIAKLFQAEDALEAVEFASDNLGDAQDILRSVIDTTTGSIDRQRTALLLLAQAKALAAVQGSRERTQELRGDLEGAAGETELVRGLFGLPIPGGTPGSGRGLLRKKTDTANIVRGMLDGSITAQQATEQLGALRASGSISANDEIQLSSTIANLGVENVNLDRNQAMLRFLNDEATAEDRELLGISDLVDDPDKPGARNSRARSRRGSRGPSQSEINSRYEADLVAVTQRILQARAQIATNAEDRAKLQLRQVELSRRTAQAEIEADEHLSDVQKGELIAAEERLAMAEREVVEFNKRGQLESEARALSEERYTNTREALDLELELADTEADRKAIALKTLEAEEQFLRQRLLAIIFSETATQAEKERAEVALAAIRNTSAGRRAAVARANETSVEGYLRGLDLSKEQLNEAIDGITISGLENLNEGLIDVITGVQSLGDVFSSVADQIISDLLRIAIQQAIIKPLAESLFGGGGSGGGDLGGSISGIGELFAGFFATGGLIPNGQFGIVGEEGPEAVFATSSGLNVVPAGKTRQMTGADGGAGTSVSIPISIDATGADAAGLERVRAEIRRLRQELPGTIITTIQDADSRRIINLQGGL